MYTVTGDLAADKNAKLVSHMSHKVELTGDVTEKDGQLMIAASNLKMISNRFTSLPAFGTPRPEVGASSLQTQPEVDVSFLVESQLGLAKDFT